MDYGLVYAKIVNCNFILGRDLSNFIYSSLNYLKCEYDINLNLYKESKDSDLFKINIYLLGLELKRFLLSLDSIDNSSFDKNNKYYYTDFYNDVVKLINRIHNKMLKWQI